MNIRSALLALVLLAAGSVALRAQPAAPASAPLAPSLVTNGDFSAASADPRWPADWPRDNQNSATYLNENGVHFLRFVAATPGQVIELNRDVPVPAGIRAVALSVRFRIADFKFGTNSSGAPSFSKDMHVTYKFIDAQGQPIPKAGGGFVLDSHAQTWRDVSRRFLVPEGAVALRVIPTLMQVTSGTLDLAGVSVAALPADEVEAMIQAPALAAKKKAEAEADIPAMLALPSKTLVLRVSGNKLVTADGKTVVLRGVNICSLEWSEKGEHIYPSTRLTLKEWGANAIRLPVLDGFWFGNGKPPKITSNDAEAYRKIVDDVIKMAAGQGAYVILDLHRFGIPEERDVAFWKDAAARYKDNPAVLFDIFNEPGGIKWEIWRDGGDMQWKKKKGEDVAPTVRSVGMQALVNAVRSTGAKNIVIAGGIGSAYDLTGVLNGFTLDDKGGNGIMYATHFYNWHGGWQKHFLDLAAKYPIFVGEFGASNKKVGFIPGNKQEDPYTWMPDALALLQKYNLNWTAFCLHPKSWPPMIQDWDYTTTPEFGAFVKDALAGKKFELRKMR